MGPQECNCVMSSAISLGRVLSLRETTWMCNDLIRLQYTSQQDRWENVWKLALGKVKANKNLPQVLLEDLRQGREAGSWMKLLVSKGKKISLRSHAHKSLNELRFILRTHFPQPWNKCEPNCEKQTLTILLSLPIHSNNLQSWIITLYFFFASEDLEIFKENL